VRFLDGFPFLGHFFEGMRRAILAELERAKTEYLAATRGSSF